MKHINQLNNLLLFYKNQTELADELNVSASCLSRWLAGERLPRRKQAITIDALYIKINPDEQLSIFDTAI